MSLRGFERVSSRASQVNDDVNIKLRVSESSLSFSPDACMRPPKLYEYGSVFSDLLMGGKK